MLRVQMLLFSWAQFDPLAAIEYCNSRASGIGAGFAAAGVIEGWATMIRLQQKIGWKTQITLGWQNFIILD